MINIKEELESLIPKKNIKYDEPMSKHTTFKTGGKAKYYIIAKKEEEVKKVQEISQKYNIPLYIIGNGSNLLVKDEGIDGIVLKIAIEKIDIQEKERNDICYNRCRD